MQQLMPNLQLKLWKVDGSNQPLSLGKVYCYYTGTTDFAPTYQNEGGAENPNPVILDINGEAQIWLSSEIVYDIVVTDSIGDEQFTRERVSVGGTGTTPVGGDFVRKTTTSGVQQVVATDLRTSKVTGMITRAGLLEMRDGVMTLTNSIQAPSNNLTVNSPEKSKITLDNNIIATVDSTVNATNTGINAPVVTVSENIVAKTDSASFVKKYNPITDDFIIYDTVHGEGDRYARISETDAGIIDAIADTATIDLDVTAKVLTANVVNGSIDLSKVNQTSLNTAYLPKSFSSPQILNWSGVSQFTFTGAGNFVATDLAGSNAIMLLPNTKQIRFNDNLLDASASGTYTWTMPAASGTVALTNSSSSGYVLKTGDTMSGALTILSEAPGALLTLNSGTADFAQIRSKGNLNTVGWDIGSGSNGWFAVRNADTGTTTFQLSRTTNNATFTNRVTANSLYSTAELNIGTTGTFGGNVSITNNVGGNMLSLLSGTANAAQIRFNGNSTTAGYRFGTASDTSGDFILQNDDTSTTVLRINKGTNLTTFGGSVQINANSSFFRSNRPEATVETTHFYATRGDGSGQAFSINSFSSSANNLTRIVHDLDGVDVLDYTKTALTIGVPTTFNGNNTHQHASDIRSFYTVNSITTGQIQAVPNDFRIASLGSGINLSFFTNGASRGFISGTTNEWNFSTRINGITGTFSGLISASTAPTLGEHLTNKTYVDGQVSGLSTVYQPLNSNLTALSSLSGSSGLIRRTGSSYVYDNTIYATLTDLGNYLPLAGGTMTGAINMGAFDINNISQARFNNNANAYVTNQTTPVIYATSTGGTGRFAEAGNLIISPRISGASRDVVISSLGTKADLSVDRLGNTNILGNLNVGDSVSYANMPTTTWEIDLGTTSSQSVDDTRPARWTNRVSGTNSTGYELRWLSESRSGAGMGAITERMMLNNNALTLTTQNARGIRLNSTVSGSQIQFTSLDNANGWRSGISSDANGDFIVVNDTGVTVPFKIAKSNNAVTLLGSLTGTSAAFPSTPSGTVVAGGWLGLDASGNVVKNNLSITGFMTTAGHNDLTTPWSAGDASTWGTSSVGIQLDPVGTYGAYIKGNTLIEQAVSQALTLYRPVTSNGSDICLHFDAQNSLGNQVNYAQLCGNIVDSTNGSVDGSLVVKVTENNIAGQVAATFTKNDLSLTGSLTLPSGNFAPVNSNGDTLYSGGGIFFRANDATSPANVQIGGANSLFVKANAWADVSYLSSTYSCESIFSGNLGVNGRILAKNRLTLQQSGTGNTGFIMDIEENGGSLRFTTILSGGFDFNSAKLTTAVPNTGYASINLPHGTAPTTPVNGDMWTTTAGGLFYRINGATKTSVDVETTQTISAAKTFSSTSGVVGRTFRTTAQSFTPTGTTQTAALGTGQAVNMILTSSTGNVTLTLTGMLGDATGYIYVTGHASATRDLILTASGVTFRMTGKTPGATVTLDTIPINGWACYQLQWRSATECFVTRQALG